MSGPFDSIQETTPKLIFNQHKIMENIHHHFARIFSISLSAFLRTIVDVKLNNLYHLNYQDYINAVPNPTYLCIVNMDPLEGKALVELPHTFTFPIVDRLAGGRGISYEGNRELTEIEMVMVEKLLYRMFDCLHEAWANTFPLNMSLEQPETNPALLQQFYLSDETVFVPTFDVQCQDIKSTFNFCYPFPTIEPFISAFDYWFDIGYEYFYSAYVYVPDSLSKATVPVHADGKPFDMSLAEVVWEGSIENGFIPKNKEGGIIQCIGTPLPFEFNTNSESQK